MVRIWLSLNFDFFTQNLLRDRLRENSTFEHRYFSGGLPLYQILFQYIGASIKKYAKAEYSLDREDIMFMDKARSIVVDSKKRRFADYVKETKNRERLDASEIFHAITRPLDQIRLQTQSIHSFLTHLDERYKDGKAGYRVGLLRIENGTPIEWLEYIGGDGAPSLSPQELSQSGSTVMECLRVRRTVVIPDIAKELRKSQGNRRYTELDGVPSKEGSLMCCPVKYSYNSSTNIPYVITIATDVKNHFQPVELYEWVVGNFISRMVLEHNLVILKEKSS